MDISLLEMDTPPRGQPVPASAPRPETPPLDLIDNPADPSCIECQAKRPVNDAGLCEACYGNLVDVERQAHADNTAATAELMGAESGTVQASVESLVSELRSVAAEGASNAAVESIGSMRGGEMLGVGFRTAEGYARAIRNGVPAATHAEYKTILRTRFRWDAAALNALPGPAAELVAPAAPAAGAAPLVTHVPTGPSLFDRPRAERAFVVGATKDMEKTDAVKALSNQELIAGVGDSNAVFAWVGTSQTTRGALLEALRGIGREDLGPSATSDRAQVGAVLGWMAQHRGLDVRAVRKSATDQNITGHSWTVGNVNHAGAVGDNYGRIAARFHLAEDGKLTFAPDGDAELGTKVVAEYDRRVGAEVFKSSDLTGWLAGVMRNRFRAVAFGALGWLVPRRHVAEARALCEAVRKVFGTGWVTGLPVMSCDQLRDGIADGLREEVRAISARLARERAEAAEAADKSDRKRAEADGGKIARGDIGAKRAATFRSELRAVGGRVAAYGQMIGEDHLANCRAELRAAIAQVEEVLGQDSTGSLARFDALWDELRAENERNGGSL